MTWKRAWKDSLPVMAGYVVLGTGFGMLLESKGYGVVWAFAMSLFIYAGSMQYVAIDLLAGGASLLTAAFMTVMVNARHIFYGISMLVRYRDMGKAKPYLIFSLTDETYSLVCSGAPKGVEEKKYYVLLSCMNQFYWVLGSVLGAVLGSMLKLNTAGIEFSMTALFLVVFLEQWKGTKDHKSAFIGVGTSLVCLFLFGPGQFVLPSMIAITALLLLTGRQEMTKEEKKNEPLA